MSERGMFGGRISRVGGDFGSSVGGAAAITRAERARARHLRVSRDDRPLITNQTMPRSQLNYNINERRINFARATCRTLARKLSGTKWPFLASTTKFAKFPIELFKLLRDAISKFVARTWVGT